MSVKTTKDKSNKLGSGGRAAQKAPANPPKYGGKGTRARLNTAAEKSLFGRKN